MKITRATIKKKLLNGEWLSDRAEQFVRDKLEPKYTNECGLCRFNTLLTLGVSASKAFEALEYDHADYPVEE